MEDYQRWDSREFNHHHHTPNFAVAKWPGMPFCQDITIRVLWGHPSDLLYVFFIAFYCAAKPNPRCWLLPKMPYMALSPGYLKGRLLPHGPAHTLSVEMLFLCSSAIRNDIEQDLLSGDPSAVEFPPLCSTCHDAVHL